MRLFYFSEYICTGCDAGNKARNDVEKILASKYIPLNIYYSTKKRRYYIHKLLRVIKVLVQTTSQDRIIIQYPMHDGYNWMLKMITNVRKCTIIIHDLTELRVGNNSGNEIKRIQNAEYIISHNNKMTQYLISNNIDKNQIMQLQIFDYLTNNNTHKITHFRDSAGLCFAGNLQKAGFLYSMPQEVYNLGINLYGINFQKEYTVSGLHYYGAFDSEVIHEVIQGRFGLVWDGDSSEDCVGNFGEYMKYNNPHKLSMYMAAGLPVIVWKQAAVSNFVLESNIGFAVSSLKEIVDIDRKITEEQYHEMEKNVFKWNTMITQGLILKNILRKIEK